MKTTLIIESDTNFHSIYVWTTKQLGVGKFEQSEAITCGFKSELPSLFGKIAALLRTSDDLEDAPRIEPTVDAPEIEGAA